MTHAFPGSSSPRAIEALAASQHGLFSRNQLLDLGVGRGTIEHRVASGKWERILPGVYRIAGAPTTWKQELLATVLWAGEGAAASHRSAAALFELEGFAADKIEISSTRKLRVPRNSGVVVHRVKGFGVADLSTVDGIPVTSPARTISDIAGLGELRATERALDDGLRRKLVTLVRMAWQIRQSRGKRGIKELAMLVEDRRTYGVPSSELERTSYD
jgi:predicted transcriptional regulator of viral defense system